MDTEQFKANLSDFIKSEMHGLGENAFCHPNTAFFKVLREINLYEAEFIANSGDLVGMAVKHSDTYARLSEKDRQFVTFWLEEEIFSL